MQAPLHTLPELRAQIGFSVPKGPRGWLPRAISRVTSTPASHVWLVYTDPHFLTEVVLEPGTRGFRMLPLSYFEKRNEVRVIFQPKPAIDRGLGAALRWLGSAYNFGGLFGMSFDAFKVRAHRALLGPLAFRKSQFSSEIMLRILHGADYPGSRSFKPEESDPHILARLLTISGSRRIR